MTFKGVFFDFYGTLLVYGDMQAAWADWLAAFYGRLAANGLSMPQEAFAERCDGFFSRPAPSSQDDGLTIYERRIQALCQGLGLDMGELQIQKTAEATIAAWNQHVSLDPDAKDVLSALRRTRTIGLISNYDHPPHVYLLLARLGMAALFDVVVVSGEVGVEKPDPRIFELAVKQARLQPREVVYVGDTADDVHGALDAGLCPILIRREGAAPDQEISDFNVDRQPGTRVALDGVETIAKLPDLVEMFRKHFRRYREEE
ncbi:MAG: HAD family hydrolase [Anaerolineae bacterium]|nr:HAD family hydrolase [Anaerolineae bacterium]